MRLTIIGALPLVAWSFAVFTGSVNADRSPATSLIGIDHLLYASATLEQGMDDIEQLLGVRPVRGGRHPQYGTHNALVSLGPTTYLEVIARDPDLPVPERGALVDISAAGESGLMRWAFRTEDIDATAESARNAGVPLGPVESGVREKPDGSALRWKLTDPIPMSMGGAIPFLISWGDTTHPASVVPSGGQLIDLRIEHPDENDVRNALSAIGANVTVVHGDAFRIIATVRRTDGRIVTIQ